jgi:hypothetical protein
LGTEQNRLGKGLMNMYNAAGDSTAVQDALTAVNLLGDPALLVAGPAAAQIYQQEGTP